MHGEAIGLPKNFTILDADESESLLKQVVETESKLFFKDKTNPRSGPLFSVLSLARNTQSTLADTVEQHFPQYRDIAVALPTFAAAYARRKREQNVCDYDDLLELWLELLKRDTQVAEYFAHRFRHVLVDEYQDTNTLQSQIVDRIASHHCLMAVGDDAQCIYSWRGADFANIMTFPERHPGTVIHRIETNYRSTPEILNLANGVLLAQPKGRHFDKELRASRGHSHKPFLVQTMDEREQADFVLKRLRSLTEDEGVSMSDIAVLYRSHFVALEVQLALSRAGVPYQITSGVKFFERQHIRDLVALIQFVFNPRNESAWTRIAILLPKVGEKGAHKIYQAALEHAQLLQRDFLDVLSSDDVRSKVARDARDDWENFCVSLRQVAEAMRPALERLAARLGVTVRQINAAPGTSIIAPTSNSAGAAIFSASSSAAHSCSRAFAATTSSTVVTIGNMIPTRLHAPALKSARSCRLNKSVRPKLKRIPRQPKNGFGSGFKLYPSSTLSPPKSSVLKITNLGSIATITCRYAAASQSSDAVGSAKCKNSVRNSPTSSAPLSFNPSNSSKNSPFTPTSTVSPSSVCAASCRRSCNTSSRFSAAASRTRDSFSVVSDGFKISTPSSPSINTRSPECSSSEMPANRTTAGTFIDRAMIAACDTALPVSTANASTRLRSNCTVSDGVKSFATTITG
jgi:hypothetical protein